MTTQTKHDGYDNLLKFLRMWSLPPDSWQRQSADAIETLTEEKERLQGYVSDWRDKCVDLERRVERFTKDRDEAAADRDKAIERHDAAMNKLKTLTAENISLRAALGNAMFSWKLCRQELGDSNRTIEASALFLMAKPLLCPELQPEGQDNG